MFARLLDRAFPQDVLGAKTEKGKVMTDAESYSLRDGELLELVALEEPVFPFALEAKWFAGIFLLKSGSRRSLMSAGVSTDITAVVSIILRE